MGVRSVIRAAVLVAAAAGFCGALSLTASADVVEPTSAYQPASTGLIEEGSTAAALKELEAAEEANPPAEQTEKAKPAEEEAAPASPAPVPVTPAPEHVVRSARVPAAESAQSTSSVSVTLVDHITQPFRIGLEIIEASLGRVVSACDAGFGTGAGGPALILAVLALAAPLIRRRVIGTRWTTDEDVPEFLFAWEQTPPG
jgi:hypothetical protein